MIIGMGLLSYHIKMMRRNEPLKSGTKNDHQIGSKVVLYETES